MPSSATDLLRLQKMGTGEKVNTWGAELNDSVIELLEDAIAGWQTVTITGNRTLTSTNYASDEARSAALNLTGSPASGFTLTIPGASKVYWIRNATGQTATISAGGATCSVYAGELIAILTDGTDCYRHERNRQDQALHMGGNKITNLATPTADTDAATKAYADTTISAAAASAAAALASENAAAASATAAANSFDAFDDKYLGAKSSAPTLDNDGDPLATGALYLNSVTQLFYVWTGSAWQAIGTGTISTQDSDAVAITGGTISGLTSLGVGGTPAANTSLHVMRGDSQGIALFERTGANPGYAKFTAQANAMYLDLQGNSVNHTRLISDSAGDFQIQTAGALGFTLDTSQNATFEGNIAFSGASTAQIWNTTTNGHTRFRSSAGGSFIFTNTGADPEVFAHFQKASAGAKSWTPPFTAVAAFEYNNSALFQFVTPNTAEAGFWFSDTDDRDVGSLVYSHATDSLSIRTANALALTIDSNQNADFEGDVTLGAGQLVNIGGTTAGTPLTVQTSGNTYIMMRSTWGGNARVNLNFEAASDTASAGLAFSRAGLGSRGAMKYLYAASGVDEKFVTNISGLDVMAVGYYGVGIGTNDPDDKLHVNGGNLRVQTSTPILRLLANSPTLTSRIYFGNTTAGELRGAFFYNHTDDSLDIWTAGAVAMSIASNNDVTFEGNVGIGGETGFPLAVGGQSQFTHTGQQVMRVRRSTNNAYSVADIQGFTQNASSAYVASASFGFGLADTTAGAEDGYMRFTAMEAGTAQTVYAVVGAGSHQWSLNNSVLMRLDTNGLGIGGTASANHSLHVQRGDANVIAKFERTGGNESSGWFSSAGNAMYLTLKGLGTGKEVELLGTSTGAFELHTAGATALSIDTSQNATFEESVGIGGAPLTFGSGYSGAHISGAAPELHLTNLGNGTGASDGLAIRVNSSGIARIIQHEAQSLELHTNGVRALTLDASRNADFAADAKVTGQIAAKAGSTLAISSGAITVTGSFHMLQGEGGAGSADALDTISGGQDGAILVLRAESGYEATITLTTSGNITGPVGAIFGDDTATLIYDATQAKWLVISIT